MRCRYNYPRNEAEYKKFIEGAIKPFIATPREEEILCRCVSYDQYRELEDKVETLTVRVNELLEYLANTSGNEHLREMKVDEE